MNKIIVILYCVLLVSCTSNSQEMKNKLNGNWYTNYIIKGGELNSNYTEVFFHHDTIFSCTESFGIRTPRKFIVSNDSIFFDPKEYSNFIGIIQSITGDNFLLEVEGEGKYLYFKIKEGATLEDIQMKNATQGDFIESFHERMNKEKSK